MSPSHQPRYQFGLRSLFRLMAVLASTAAIFAWLNPYFAVGVDPPLIAVPFLALALGVFVVALLNSRSSQ